MNIARRSVATAHEDVLLPLINSFGWVEAAKQNHMRVETLAAILAFRRVPAPAEPSATTIARSWAHIHRAERKKADARRAADLVEHEAALNARVYEPWDSPDVDKLFIAGSRILSPSRKYSVGFTWAERHTGWVMEEVVCVNVELMASKDRLGHHPSIHYVVFDNGDGTRTQRLAVDDFDEPMDRGDELFAIRWEAQHRKLSKHIFAIAMARSEAENHRRE